MSRVKKRHISEHTLSGMVKEHTIVTRVSFCVYVIPQDLDIIVSIISGLLVIGAECVEKFMNYDSCELK